ncbi:polyphosphate kinase 1 [Algisphaera agarilytica]|uniref:Polyphosphate kinase n=1 Tax=Algisphaera agarilytica TaxID=1385975 RepID=A0A7X0H884_9BACT|nr:polyphosphate kinase 1 [Algisphaera agarilytica]MBB6429624.1 polyphosphate kinase [Algisphaera agarilytica]
MSDTSTPDTKPAHAATLPIDAPPAEGEFLNRESSWLEFNRRVLHEALDERTPLLERVGFLAIFNSNLDEYYQKRVGGLKRQIEAGLMTRTVDGLSPEQQIEMIRELVIPMLDVQAQCFTEVVKPALKAKGIHLLAWEELSDAEREEANEYFMTNLFPVVTPLSVDPGHPFPFISNLSTSLGVMLQHPVVEKNDPMMSPIQTPSVDGEAELEDNAGRMQFARVKVPQVLPSWVKLAGDDGQDKFISTEQVIRHNLDKLFDGMIIKHVEPFRITRNADVERDEEDAEDLLELIEQELRDRRFADAVRLETDDAPFHPMNHFLMQELGLQQDDVYQMPAELDFNDLWEIHGSVNRPDLKYEPWTPMVPTRLADVDSNIFSVIRNGDILVHHPYESFSASVERFIRRAATDPDVIAIKLTLYRTAKDSPFIPDLIKAAEAGKQVVVLVELKARFDEERNVQLAQRLEKAGIHVVYGVVGYKTHTKTSLVVRKEKDGLRTYAHIGTGNYNSKTANLYTDLGLFTCDPRITGDLVEVFHLLTGRSLKRDFNHLLIAPTNMRKRFVEMIDREIAHAQAWKQAGSHEDDRPLIVAKMNSLEDRRMCRKLYEASNAGVKIQLIVRGFCTLRPGVPGLSENITVQSVIGRFLEHSRIYHYRNGQGVTSYDPTQVTAKTSGSEETGRGGNAEYYIGSADWMYRNLNNRVECITPVYDPALQAKLKTIVDTMLADHRQTWDMDAEGNYTQRTPPKITEKNAATPAVVGTHQHLMDLTRLELADG